MVVVSGRAPLSALRRRQQARWSRPLRRKAPPPELVRAAVAEARAQRKAGASARSFLRLISDALGAWRR